MGTLLDIIIAVVKLVLRWATKEAGGINPPPKPETPKERADNDMQEMEKAVVNGDSNALNVLFEQLHRDSQAGTAVSKGDNTSG